MTGSRLHRVSVAVVRLDVGVVAVRRQEVEGVVRVVIAVRVAAVDVAARHLTPLALVLVCARDKSFNNCLCAA